MMMRRKRDNTEPGSAPVLLTQRDNRETTCGDGVCFLPGVGFTVIFSGYNIFKQLSTCYTDGDTHSKHAHLVCCV